MENKDLIKILKKEGFKHENLGEEGIDYYTDNVSVFFNKQENIKALIFVVNLFT